jgi:hypothetical protein
MPFKYDPGISDETDQKIISILYFGRKRQNEIVSLIDKSKSTTINHLDFLVEHHKVERYEKNDANEVYYQLEDGREEIVPPYPLADDNKIYEILFTIKDSLKRIFQPNQHKNSNEGNGEDQSKEAKNTEKTVEKDVIDEINKEMEKEEVLDNLLKSTSEFYELSTKRYHMLSNEENFDLYFDVLDIILENYKRYETEEKYFNHPLKAFDNFIMVANELYVNYENGEENEKYASKLSNRGSEIVELVRLLPSHSGDSLMALAFAIDQNHGQEALMNAIKSGKYDIDRLVLRAFEKYIRRGHTDDLFDHLTELEETDNGKYREDVKEIKKRIRKRYYQVSNNSDL